MQPNVDTSIGAAQPVPFGLVLLRCAVEHDSHHHGGTYHTKISPIVHACLGTVAGVVWFTAYGVSLLS